MATLVPPESTIPPPGSNPTATEPEKVDYRNLPCPIPYEEIHREALMSLKPDLFEGMRFDFTKGLSPKFSLSHSLSMGPTELPSQSAEIIKIPTANYEFGANFLDPKLILFGRIMTDGRLSARLKCDLTENLTMKANAQLTNEPHMSHGMFNFDYKGTDYRTQFQLGNGALFGANYIQSVTPHLSLGGEVFWAGQHRKSGIGYAARYNTDKMVATGQVASTGMVALSYVQKVSEKVSLATDFMYNYMSKDVTASVGYDYILRQCRLRGKIDSNGCTSAFLEERLNMGVNFIMSAERCGSQKPLQSTVCLEKEQEFAVKPTKFVSDLQDKPEEQLGSSPRKRVTFDTNVRTYEPVPINESSESLLNGERIVEREDDSIGSYPANHRYQNSGDSDDDELEETEYDDSDLDDGEDDENQDYEEFDDDYDAGIVVQKVWSESIPTESIESRTEFSSLNSNRNARDRSLYVHPVLNPVENLTQWRAVKSKPAAAPPPVKNYRAAGEEEQQQEPCISFSSEPIFKPKSNKPKNSIQEIAVDASLSNWLLSSPQTTTRTTTTPKQQKATIFTEFCETANSGSQFSPGSNSGLSFEDRPILGALTIEELKQFSASNSPRKSPRRRIPDEMPIIGTVGSYWNEIESSMDSGSVSSYKGMPNTVRCF